MGGSSELSDIRVSESQKLQNDHLITIVRCYFQQG